ncbi:hypothetical protein GMI70_06890 [Eggerthellaceae bacterium zg-893]|nr:hypothetical protein [Eggerthellaceae bacterium zg-893]
MGVIYDGVDLGRWLNIAYDEALAPPVDVETADVPGRDGSLFRRARLAEKTIPMRLRLRALPSCDAAEYRRRIAPLLVKDRPCELVLPGDRTRRYMAILSGESGLDTLWYTGSASVTFVCPDPVAYGKTRACAFAASMAGEYDGTYPAAPRFSAVPPSGQDGYRVENAKTGEFVEVEHAFDGGQDVVVDCESCTAAVAGRRVPVTFASDYFRIAPGAFEVRATAASTMQFEERWL